MQRFGVRPARFWKSLTQFPGIYGRPAEPMA
jgi:hypothetical protein